MASSLRNDIKEAKKHLVDLQEDVEEFEKRLRQGIERTKKSIEKLSIDCELNCIKVWGEFDEFLEKTRMKAAELCNQMKEKTTEEERKWRQILEEKENLLEEAGKWLLDLRHLLVASNDDEGVVSGVQLLRAELPGRLHESFTTVDEGHFVVTFPEWCQRSLNQLQEEIVDFTVKTWPPRELEFQSECRLLGSNLGSILSIAVSDEDGHVFVVDGSDKSIKEFGETGEFVGRCPLRDEGFLPWDICFLSQDNFIVCGAGRGCGDVLFVARKKNRPFLEKGKRIRTKKNEFSSLCQMNEKIFVCNSDFEEIFCYSKEGNEIKRIQFEKSLGSGSAPRLRADPTTGNLWGTRLGMSKIFVWKQNGQILQIVKTKEKILDFCADENGQFYFCNKEGIFSVLPEKVIYKFPKKSENFPRIFVSGKKFFVCFENDGENLIKILKIN